MHSWLSQSFDNIANVYKLIFILSGYAEFSSNTDYESDLPIVDSFDFNLDEEIDKLDFEDDFVLEYLNEFKTICESSSALVHSLLIVWLFRSILIQVIQC